MKNYIPYILGILLIGAVVALIATGNNSKTGERELNERITLQKRDKIPYGTYVAYQGLQDLFPAATVFSTREEPGYWKELSLDEPKQLFVCISDRFLANEYELKSLIEFVENGNDVFVSAMHFSATAEKIFGCNTTSFNQFFTDVSDLKKIMRVTLTRPPFEGETSFKYPGRSFNSYFKKVDTSTTTILGYDGKGRPNFIRLQAGKGHFYIHTEPLAFSNYFLLHKKNIGYYENVFSLVQPGTKKVVWDEYFIHKRDGGEPPPRKKGWLSVLLSYPALRAALLTAIFTLIIFVLMEMRRKQRPIPVIRKPKNDSLEFVKTIGRLYYDKGDHRNLCRKMSAYFLEHVRSRYKLATGKLDDEFISLLHQKTGVEKTEISAIVGSIKYMNEAGVIGSNDLTHFYKQLESFYKKA